MTKRDYYEVLSVARTADDETLKKSYRKLALQYHPDRNPGDRASEEKFKEAAEAYAILARREVRELVDAGRGRGCGRHRRGCGRGKRLRRHQRRRGSRQRDGGVMPMAVLDGPHFSRRSLAGWRRSRVSVAMDGALCA